MEPILPAFIDVKEQDQAQEIRAYLKSCGADINEESMSPLHEDLEQLLIACDINFRTEAELEGVMNSLLSLILIVTEKRDDLIRKFCDKVAEVTSEEDTSLTRLRILSILLNGLHERDPVRYDVYCTQVKVAGKAGLIDQINVSLDQVRSWLNMWEVDGMKARKVYRLLFDALTEDRQSEEATSVMVELLRTYTDENASEVKDDAKNCIVSLLGRPNVLIMDFLLTLPPVAALQGEPIYKLLTIFVSGKLADYMEFYEKNKDFVDSCGLTHEKNLHKMRVLTFMSLGEAKSEVHFDDLCKELNISVDDIEEFIIEALRSKLVRTRIDQVNKKVIISSATHRTFGNNQWQELRNRLEEWRQSLQSVGTSLKAVVPAVDG
ncbi:eukaryotic translation initiation factor 3 subunit M-like [Stylophora pistillata]|uniref:Eukaryotic translation initiation factor 3 subunit M n=1 Tax=Stylophora pistillata TaxID=50429 RepID=A0A2B4SSI7_STYPI|nr:eukaryotic translation initiation factor 3 subunit M-like [Stylophora pistillata]PFX32053.1 Eukaryotic translation initiation factor 3 subunit M [Stylophora pistillata]